MREEIMYDNGDRYIGELDNAKKDGYGIMFYGNNDRYQGDWKADKRHGNGIMEYYNNDTYYDGDWIKDKRQGKGVLKYTDNDDIIYEGEWYNDNPKKLQSIFKHIPKNASAYDPISLDKYVITKKNARENIIFVISTSENELDMYYQIKRKNIKTILENTSNILYECLEANEILDMNNINTKNQYIRMNSMGIPIGDDFISIKTIESILENKDQIYNIIRSEKKLASVVSMNVFDNNGTGSYYCQAGKGGYVYELKKVVRAYSKRSRKVVLSIPHKKSKKNSKKTRKTKT